MLHDIRYASRTLRKSPAFACAAILTLGLGLGANMAIFRFVDALLLQNLPVRDPHELVIVRPWVFSYPSYRQLAERNTDVFASVAARWTSRINLTADGATEYVPAELVSGSYFDTLGVRAAAGRLLTADDDGAEGAHPVCVIGYGLWQRRFDGQPVVGRTIELNATPFEIVGVSEQGFHGADLHARHEVQIPMSMTSLFAGMERDSNGWSWLTIVGRLKAGVSRRQAEAAVRARFEPHGDWQKPAELRLAEGRQGFASLRSQFGDPVLMAQLLSACVLLIACANLANLLLSKTAARRHELAVRRSLGASRVRIVAHVLAESLLLVAAGVVVGGGVAAIVDRMVYAMLSEPGSNLNVAGGSGPITAATFALAVIVALAIGLLPAIAATGGAALDGLRDTARTSARQAWLGRALVLTQVVVCLVLVFAAGLFARSLRNLHAVDLGFTPDRVVVLTTDPERSGYSLERRREFYEEWLRRARLVPGVSAASLASITAVSGGMFAGVVTVPGGAAHTGPEPNNNFNVVSAGYFETIGLPLVSGRTFTERDGASAPPVAIVNEQFVQYYWPGQPAIGRQIRVFRRTVEIVGVVRTAKYQAIREAPQITIYFPMTQRPVGEMTLHARVAGAVAPATAGLIASVRAIDSRVPAYNAGTLRDHVNARLANERVLNVLSLLFAALALVVASAGVYGVVAYAVVRRTREVGIRVAIGAQRWQILRLFLTDATALIAAGLAAGVPLALLVGRKFGSVLYGLEPSSLSTLLGAGALLAAVAVAAAGIPALRATMVDPIAALRTE